MSEETEIEVIDETTDQESDESTGGRNPPSLLGRLIFGGVLAYLAIENFRNIEDQIGYAEAKGIPEADKLVPLASGTLAFGSIGIILWRFPTLAAGAVAAFMAGTTPTMHDFWAADDPQERQVEQYQFLKNVAMFGAAVAFLRRARER